MAKPQNGARMISAASQRVISLSGHSKYMKAMTPTLVPPQLVEAALAKGCAMCDDEDLQRLAEAARENSRGDIERHDKLIAAINDLVVENDGDKFAGTGLPKVDALEAQVGFKLKAEERDDAWKAWNDQNRQAQLEAENGGEGEVD